MSVPGAGNCLFSQLAMFPLAVRRGDFVCFIFPLNFVLYFWYVLRILNKVIYEHICIIYPEFSAHVLLMHM